MTATWNGGTHRVSDPGVWSPTPAPTGDSGAVFGSGHVIAYNQTVTLDLGLAGDTVSTATFDAFDVKVGSIGPIFGDGGNIVPQLGTAAFVGSNTVGGLDPGENFGTTNLLSVVIADVAGPAGTVIQQGVLTNTGTITSQSASYDAAGMLTIKGSSADAMLVNNGTIDEFNGDISIGVAVTGTGTMSLAADLQRESSLTLSKAVAAGQSVDVESGFLFLGDPINFRGTIGGFADSVPFGNYSDKYVQFAKSVTSALFLNHVLYLKAGTTLVAALRFSNDVLASDLTINTGSSGTYIRSTVWGWSYTPPGNVTIATTGAAPAVPPIVLAPSVVTLPTSGPNVTFTTGAHIASSETLNNQTLSLEGLSASTEPALDETNTSFGSHFGLNVLGQGSAARFGALFATGLNQNNGLIETSTGATGGAATLGITVSDVVSPTGVTILSGTFTNVGTIDAGAGTTISITGSATSTLINNGTIAANGMLFLGTQVGGNGTISVGAGGSVEASRYVGLTPSVALKAGTLTLDHINAFLASVLDFNKLAKIVVKGVTATTVTYKPGALLLDGGSHGQIHLVAPAGASFTSSSFLLAHSGADTIITTSNTIV